MLACCKAVWMRVPSPKTDTLYPTAFEEKSLLITQCKESLGKLYQSDQPIRLTRSDPSPNYLLRHIKCSGLASLGLLVSSWGNMFSMGCSYIELEGYTITLCKEQKEHPGIGASSSPCFRFQQIPRPSIFHQPVCGEGWTNRSDLSLFQNFYQGSNLRGCSRRLVGVLSCSCLRNLENRIRKWGRGS